MNLLFLNSGLKDILKFYGISWKKLFFHGHISSRVYSRPSLISSLLGGEDPLSQFLDLSCDGASDALEKIERLPSINDPETMELSYGKLMAESENSKPSRLLNKELIQYVPSKMVKISVRPISSTS